MTTRLRDTFRSPRSVPVITALLAPLLLFADVLFTGRALIWGLPALQFVPWRYAAWLSLISGRLPLWNPLNGMGAPLLANDQLAFYYPPGWLLFPFTAAGGAPALAWAFTLLVALHMAWAGFGMTRLLRDLGMGPLSQAVGALAFGLCGYFAARNGVFPMIWTGAWLPWVLLAANRVASPLASRVTARWLPLSVTVALMLLAGHAQLAWYTLLLAVSWVLVWSFGAGGWRGALKGAGVFALAGLAAGLLSAAQLVPTAEYLLQSQRSAFVDYDLAMTYSFWPWRLLAFFAPDLFGNPGAGNYWGYAAFWEDAAYIGFLPLIMALKTLPQIWRRQPAETARFQPLVRFLWGVVGISLLLAMGTNTPVFPFLYRYVPTFNMFQAPARFLILAEIALVLLAGIGVDQWRMPSGKMLKWLRLAVAAAAALLVGAGAAWLFLREVRATFIGATALAGVWAAGTGLLALYAPPAGGTAGRRWTIVVVLWVALDLLAAGWRLHPSAPAVIYQENAVYNRPIREMLGGARLYLTQDEDYRLKFRRFLRFTDFRPIEDRQHIRQVLLPNTNLLDGIAHAGNFDPLVPGRYSVWMKALEPLTPAQRLPWLRMMDVGLVEQMNPRVRLGVDFLPVSAPFRWYWAACPVFAENEQQSWQLLQEKMSAWPGEGTPDWVVLEKVSGEPGCGGSTKASIRLVEEKDDRLVFEVSADQAGWLVLNDTWYPGWKVEIDGQMKQTLAHANYLFRAVTVPSGQHMVTFYYSPAVLYLAVWISGVCWIALLVVSLRKTRSAK